MQNDYHLGQDLKRSVFILGLIVILLFYLYGYLLSTQYPIDT